MIKGPLLFGLAIFVILGAMSLAKYIAALTAISVPKGSDVASSTGPVVLIGEHVFHVDIADTLLLRSKGLSGRESLAEDTGMYFIFTVSMKYGFWMKDMKFPIDIIWISGDKVVSASENAAPEPTKTVFTLTRYYSPVAVNRALEVPAGTVARYAIKAGDSVIFTR